MLIITRTVSLRLSMITVILLGLLCSGLSARAENETEGCLCQVDTYLRYIPSRSVDAQSGKVEIIDSQAEYSYEFKVFEKLPLKFSLGTEYIGIEDTVTVELPSHLVGLTTDIETTLPFFNFNSTYFRLGVSPSFYADDWEFSTSDFRIPSRYFLIFKPNTKLTLIGGIAVYPDFESEVLPILGFIYQPNDRLKFDIVPRRPNISYLVSEKITLFLEGGSSFNQEFEVERNNLEGAVLSYRETHLGSGLKFKLNKFMRGSISLGAVLNRSLKYRDNQGKVDIKDGLYTEFRLESTF